MNYEEFEEKLENAKINKKIFSELTALPYQTVMNWKRNDNIPVWVESWLQNYIKAKISDDIIEAVKPFVREIGQTDLS